MKILMFSADYFPDPGGIAAHVYYLSRAIAARGFDVTVVGGHVGPLRSREQPFSRSPEHFREISIRRWGPRGLRGLYFVLHAFRVLQRLAREPWDVVHFHNFFPDGLVLKLWPKAKVRVMTNHSAAFLIAHAKGRHRNAYRWFTRNVDGIVGPSRELAEKSSYFALPSQIREFIPNGVDVELFSPAADEAEGYRILGVQAGTRILLSVRRHDLTKSGLPDLLQAFSLMEHIPDITLCLVGEGDQTAKLQRMTRGLGLRGRVRFVGTLSHSVLSSVYRAAYVSILPSLYEAVSLSGLESLACACPVIGTRIGGIPEFVLEGETGYLVPPSCPKSLADALLRILANPSLRREMGDRGRNLVLREFSWDRVAERTLGLYQRCLDRIASGGRPQ